MRSMQTSGWAPGALIALALAGGAAAPAHAQAPEPQQVVEQAQRAYVFAAQWSYSAGHGPGACTREPQWIPYRKGVCLPEVRIRRGQELWLRNADGVAHDLRSYELKHGRPLFASDMLRRNTEGKVERADQLRAGHYHFFCTLHPDGPGGVGMHGMLIVEDPGLPS